MSKKKNEYTDLLADIAETLKPFAEMDREGCDLSEEAVRRGYASDLAILTSKDFRKAKLTLDIVQNLINGTNNLSIFMKK
jgi:hypothetical protein